MILALLLAAAAPDPAAAEAERFSNLVVFGDDPCPRSSQTEIVVCARLPESERFRLPKRFRGKKASEGPASVAWGRKVETLEMVSKQGLPNSCSVIGSAGQTGCFQQFMREARAQREADRLERAGIPGEDDDGK